MGCSNCNCNSRERNFGFKAEVVEVIGNKSYETTDRYVIVTIGEGYNPQEVFRKIYDPSRYAYDDHEGMLNETIEEFAKKLKEVLSGEMH